MRWAKRRADQKSKEQSAILRNLLRQARVAAGFTQIQVARQLGRDQTFMTRIESGTQDITFVELEQFAKIYRKQLSSFETIDEVERLNPSLMIPDSAWARPGPVTRKRRPKARP
jgi:transcriptional regulator with XRE-family HTH domain